MAASRWSGPVGPTTAGCARFARARANRCRRESRNSPRARRFKPFVPGLQTGPRTTESTWLCRALAPFTQEMSMNMLRLVLVCGLVLGVTAVAAAAPKVKVDPAKLVGVWEVTFDSGTVGKGATFEFTKDGKVTINFTA